MKTHFKNIILCTLIAIFVNINSLHLSQNNPFQKFLPSTPKASDLTDHFGTEPSDNLYGPDGRNPVEFLPREGIRPGGTTPITLINNYNKEINPLKVVSGNLLNTSYDASKIIKAKLADPKFEINSKIVSEAVIRTPVQLGVQHETKVTQNMNRITGEISKETVSVDKPILGEMKNLRQVETPVKTIVNIKTGEIVPLEDTKPVTHGYN